MSGLAMPTALIALAVAAGITSGITFVFSNAIMRAFDRLPAPDAVRAMQSINETVLNPLFLMVFVGTGVAALALGGTSLVAGHREPWLWLGALVYLVGVVLVTGAKNVPLNDGLAALDAASASPDAWRAYARPWTAWNRVRTVAAAAASVALMIAARS